MQLRLEPVLHSLRLVDWKRLGVRWVVLFGGLARRGWGHDVDLLVMTHPRVPRLDVSLEVSERLGVDPDKVDIVPADRAPCAIVFDAWRHGIIVYEEEPGTAREWLLVRVKVCHDYRIMVERLGVPRTAVEAMRRRWSRWGSSRG